MNPRNYQLDDCSSIKSLLSKLKSVIYCLPTGGGKTIVMAMLTEWANSLGKPVLIITDRQELLTGSANALVKFKKHPHLITAKTQSLNASHHVYVAMSQTLKRRINDPRYLRWIQTHFGMVMIDECHKEEFNVFFEKDAFMSAKVVGFTATPKRTGNSRQLAADYQAIHFGPSVQELIAMGFLSSPRYVKANLDLDYTNLRVSKISGEEDYRAEDLARVFDVDKVYKGTVEHYQREANNKLCIVSCAGSANTIKTCKAFNDAGIPAKYLITEPKSKSGAELHAQYKSEYTYERKRLLKDFENGNKFRVLVNNGILTTGYDNPKIECVIIERRTMSDNLMQQIIGRGSRVIQGVKDEFTIIDMSDNLIRLTEWHLPRVYSLHHSKSPSGKPPLKVCPKCKMNIFASAKKCTNLLNDNGERCNFVFPTSEKIAVEVEMQVVSYKELKYSEIKELCKTLSFSKINDLATQRGFLPSWIYMVAKETGRLEEYSMYLERNARHVN